MPAELSNADLLRLLATVKIAQAVYRETERLALTGDERDWLGCVVADAVRDGLLELMRQRWTILPTPILVDAPGGEELVDLAALARDVGLRG